MFFFFVGGLEQQVRRVLKSNAGKCIICGSGADLVDYDKVLKLFFIPVWRWPGQEPLMHCSNCSLFFPPRTPTEPLLDVPRCISCGRLVESNFKFCPFCGTPL